VKKSGYGENMVSYIELKHTDNGMPTREGFYYPILLVASKHKELERNKLKEQVIKEIGLPSELRNLRYTGKTKSLVASSLIGFSMSTLTSAGLLKRVSRGRYAITDLGVKLANEYEVNLTGSIITNTPAFQEYVKNKQSKKNTKQTDIIGDTTPLSNQEIGITNVDEWFNTQTQSIKEALLNNLMKMDPYSLEPLMVNLLNKMGYQGPNGQSIITQKSNDNGIDGVIYQDALGLQKVYIQVKRYSGTNPVGRPEITSFSGAIKLKHTDRGVFITTSTFTAGAIEAARNLNITTIDGDMLTNLMIKYGVGVEPVKQYNLYRIDKDVFNIN
jgi:restriction system protein